jgi:hypothetical protein
MTATCLCGGVELKAFGRPIVSSVCYCDDCRKGADLIEALPNAGAVRDPDGGTAYILYRKDRIECSKGAELLRSYKLKETSVTNRVIAACCNSAVFMNFDRGPHWVSAYTARFHGELRHCSYGFARSSSGMALNSPTTCRTTRAILRDSSLSFSHRAWLCG